MEIWGIEPQTFHMQSERSTTELYPLVPLCRKCEYAKAFRFHSCDFVAQCDSHRTMPK